MTPPARFGPYELLETLGQGGMGVVYRARDGRTGREVALKAIAESAHGAWSLRERFLREARAALRIEHPNIVRILDAGEERGMAFIVLELVEGVALDERLMKRGPLPWVEAARIAARIAHGLHAVHEKGLVHRDVKPGNIIVGADGVPKLADFGLARGTAQGDSLAASLTRAGDIVGTPEFLSPEQANAVGKVGPASDLYSLGATLFNLLTGAPPFEGPAVSLYQQHLRSTPPPPSTRGVEVPAALDALVLRLMAKEPRARGPSAAAVARELEDLVVAAAKAPPARGGRRLTLAVLGVALLAGAAGAALLVGRGATPAPSAAPPPVPAIAGPKAAPRPAKAPEVKGRPPQCQTFLSSKRTKLVGFAGDYAWRHAHPIEAIAWTPDGKTVISTGGWTERTVRAWRVADGLELWTGDLEEIATALSVSEDGKLVATGCNDGSAQLWDVATGAKVRELERFVEPVLAVAFVPKRGAVVYGGRDHELRCVDTKTFGTLWKSDTGKTVLGVAAEPQRGDLIATALEDGTLALWKADSGERATSVEAGEGSGLSCLAWSPDGNSVATSTKRGSITARLPLTLDRQGESLDALGRGPEAAVVSLAFVQDDNRIVAAYKGGEVACWQLAGKKLLTAELRGPAPTKAVAVEPRGRLVATGGDDRRVRIFDLAMESARCRQDRYDASTFVPCIAVLDRGRVVIGGDDGVLHFLDTESGREEKTVALSYGAIHSLAATRDHERLYCGTESGNLLEHAVRTGETTSLTLAYGPVSGVALSPDESKLGACTKGGELVRWDLRSGRRDEGSVRAPRPIGPCRLDAVSWAHDSETLVTVTDMGAIYVSGKGSPVRFRSNGTYLAHVACSPSSGRAIVSSHEQQVLVWSLVTNEAESGPLPCGSEVTRVVWLDAEHVAIAAFDGTIHLVSVETGKIVDVIDLKSSHDFATALAVSEGELYAVTSRGVVLRFTVNLAKD